MDYSSELGTSGARLWQHITESYDLDVNDELVLLSACRTADLCDRLAEQAAREDLTTVNHRGDTVINSVVAEHRAQAQQLTRQLAALRIPDDSGSRPQRRGAPRGAYAKRAETVQLMNARSA